MIPLRDNIPTRHFPIVTVTLIAANVVMFVLDRVVLRQEVLQPVMTQYGPRLLAHATGGLSEQYAMIPASVSSAQPGAWVTVFSSMFLHANLLHVAWNMLYLWVFGNNIEDALGKGRFVLFYLASGAVAAAAHIATGPNSTVPTVGASGAVAGLMGAYLILYPGAQILSLVPVLFISTLMEVPAAMVIGFWAVLQFVNASWLGAGDVQGGGVAYFAHVGGFVAGVVMIVLLGGRRLSDRRRAALDDDYYYRR